MAKLDSIRFLAGRWAGWVSQSPADWMRFMDTASRMYRYSFPDQLLIYAQRPNATACASLETWNTRLNRWVNRRQPAAGKAALRLRCGGYPCAIWRPASLYLACGGAAHPAAPGAPGVYLQSAGRFLLGIHAQPDRKSGRRRLSRRRPLWYRAGNDRLPAGPTSRGSKKRNLSRPV